MPHIDIQEHYENLRRELAKAVSGQHQAVEAMAVTFFAGGHLLMEGIPGTAKTLMVKALSRLLGIDFKRAQFTPDLMPSDIIGNNVFDLATTSFNLRKGPIFTDFLLADEINRTPPKTQAALLECMEERQVTVDGELYPLSEHFTVFATQNPLEYEGTYPLPEAQIDRFMAKVLIDYPTTEEELEILRRYSEGFDHRLIETELRPVISREEIASVKGFIKTVKVEHKLFDYINTLVRTTRDDPSCLLGASPRASVNLLLASRAQAAISGRDFVIPDDVKSLAHPILRHRLILKPEAELDGVVADDVVSGVIESVEVPR